VLYVEELKDLWSANEQMIKALNTIAPHATNPKLTLMLDSSKKGIAKHTVQDAPEKGPVPDAAIIAQYQRMTHYGITGFETVCAFAKALKLENDEEQLGDAVADMYQADALMTELAEDAVNVKAV
jgi:ferritin-like metal-binding protein YciE